MRNILKESGTTLPLNPEAIDTFADKVTDFLKSLETDRKELLRIRLSIEDILLKWQDHFGENAEVKLSCYSYLGQPTIQLRLVEEPFDPLTEDEEGMGSWSRNLFSNLSAVPIYSYSKNANLVVFKLEKKRKSPLFWLLIALLAAAGVSALGLALPAEFLASASEGVLTPICDTYVHVLDFFAIPLIFLSVLLGICGIGDASFFGQIGRKMVRHFMLSLLCITAVAAVVAYPFFSFAHGEGGLQVQWGQFLNMLLGFLPTSLITPFIDCNAMQLIIMGVVVGIAVLKLDPIAEGLSGVLEDLNRVLLLISQWFTRLIPFFVFTIIVKSAWSGELSRILVAWKSWVLVMVLQAAMILLMMLQISAKHKVKVGTLVKRVTATFLIAFGTNSCSATIPEIYDATAKLGVSPKVMSFGIPIGTTLFKPGTAIRLLVYSFLVASTYHVGVSVSWFLMAVLMAFILSIAVPAIPGGALMFIPMLFTQLGLPAAAVSAMIAADIFFDAFCTAFCQIAAELALVQQAGMLDMLDEEALRG